MLQFEITEAKCTKCAFCVRDCPARIIDMESGYPRIMAEKEASCLKCQHCLAICPTAALSILGRNPEQSRPLKNNLPDPDQLETLIKGRRSIRHYRDENLDPILLQRLFDVAWHAPTGVNMRQVQFSVIDDKEAMAKFREAVYSGLAKLVEAGQLPEERAMFGDFVQPWREIGFDVLFRGAPHLIVASAPRDCACPIPDCLIALSYFELFAQSLGVGTVWNGLAKYAIDELVPELRQQLGIPENHLVGYVMAFGKPAIKFQRTVEKGAANVVRFNP